MCKLRTFTLLAIVVLFSGISTSVSAQPAQISVEDCIAFDITDRQSCCYSFTLCVTNATLPDITSILLTMGNGFPQCEPPAAPAGWEATEGNNTVLWEVDNPLDAIGPQETLCGFIFASRERTTDIEVELMNNGQPVFSTTLSLTCGEDCGATPVEPGTWGRIKSIYTD